MEATLKKRMKTCSKKVTECYKEGSLVCSRDGVFLMGKNVSDSLVVLLSGKHESWVYNELIKALFDVAMVAIQDQGLLSRLN